MKIIRKEEREFWQTKTAIGYDYPFGMKNIDCSIVQINGRYPQSGWCRNTKVDEMIFVKKGVGEICFKDKLPQLIKEDDAVFIEKNELYFWTDKTNGILIPMCNPSWSNEQVEHIEFD